MKYHVDFTSNFKKQYNRMVKQGKNIANFNYIVKKLSNGEKLEEKYKNHRLMNNRKYKDCMECHIEPDWLLVYRINKKELILLLTHTGRHSDLFG